MTDRMQQLTAWVLDKKQAVWRKQINWGLLQLRFSDENRSASDRITDGFCAVLSQETPVFLPGERIAFTRTVENLPEPYTDAEMSELRKAAFYAEKGRVFNISPDYASTIAVGLDARRSEVADRLKLAEQENDASAIEFLSNALRSIDAVLALADRYREEAKKSGLDEVAALLAQVPHGPARTYPEALQMLRILHFCVWAEGEYHNGLGRFDQYLWPYLQADLDAGSLTQDEALEWTEEFFLSCNRDSDLYIGVQQGDNGQSLMLGGCDRQGNLAYNPLTYLCLTACRELKLIDPKINLRVNKETPMEVFKAATELTKVGIGFPQYANDDVVIPGLVKLGYSLEDARDYSVAACWEFLIPGCGMDIANITGVSLPAVVDRVMRTSQAKDFESFYAEVRQQLVKEADKICEMLRVVKILPGPFISLFCTGRVQAGRDVCEGNKYNNFGIHGTGFSVAVDSLESIKKWVFEEHRLTLQQMTKACDSDFKDEEQLLNDIRFHTPKMGNDIEEVDGIGVRLLADFAASWVGRKNCRGGIYRAGTGSAMYYVWHANELPATADGRLKGAPFSANFSPSLDVPVNGPISVVKSFTKPALIDAVNGGPLTMEIHDSAFRMEDGLEKVACIPKFFVERGGHQLQINAVNRDRMKDAQIHPEKHRHMIVRVWGWSGYFVELEKPYQDQIIKRVEMNP
ncbi:MAG: pyruvate formate-lyase [Kiritimatiellae bacterium]|nr:pyruvate formate-lyase [Kiritimatiellia bacterium]